MKTKLAVALVATGFLIFVNMANADCTGDLSLVDVLPQPLFEGEDFEIVAYTTVPPALGIRNLDVVLSDPFGNKVYSSEWRLGNDSYTVDLRAVVDNSFVDGTYTLSAKMEVLNPNNFSETVCTKETSQTVEIETGRKAYNDMEVSFTLLPKYQMWTYNETRNISLGEGILPVKIQMDNIPVNTNVVISDFNISTSKNATLNLTVNSPTYSLEEMMAARRIINAQTYTIKHLSENVSKEFGSVLKNITIGCRDGVMKVWEQVDSCKAEQEEYKKLIDTLENKSDTLERELAISKKREASANNSTLLTIFWILVGFSLALGIGVWLSNNKKEERKI